MFLRKDCAVALALSLLLVTACGAGKTVTVLQTGSTPASQAGAPTSQHQVIIQGAAFTPAELDIQPGDTVTWTNQDTSAHTVTSIRCFQDEDDISHIYIGETWDSGDIDPGASFSRTFSQSGSYDYFSLPLEKPSPIPQYYQLVAGIPTGVVVVK